MANVTVYLQGGPCNGATRKVPAGEVSSFPIICKGAEYLYDHGKKRPNGDFIFLYGGPTAGAGGGITASRAHHGWADVRHSLNHVMPGALRASETRTRAALRSLSRARKVKL